MKEKVSDKFSAGEEMGIQTVCNVHVTFVQAQAGVHSIVDVLQFFTSYVNETSYTVWQSLIESLSTIDRLISHTNKYEIFKRFALKLFMQAGVRLKWDPIEGECKK